MPKKSQAKNAFAGRWRIVWMDQWDQDYVDEEVEIFIHDGDDSAFRAVKAAARKRKARR